VYEQVAGIVFGIVRSVVGLFIPARVWALAFLALAIVAAYEIAG
jgi:hypothetical protein